MIAISFIIGLLIGSFLNVIILRVPENKPFAMERSECPNCGYNLRSFDLVPVASFLVLGGKCRNCKQPISRQYPLVELLSGVMFAFAFYKTGFDYIKLLESLIYISLSIVVTFTDLKFMRIPNKIVAFGMLCAIPFVIMQANYYQAFLGFLAGGGVLLLIAILSGGNMGGGDIKLVAMQGLYLGLANTLLTLFLGFVSAGVISVILIALKIRGRKDPIPFGPFLAIAGVVAFFYGSDILQWYLARF